MRALTQRQEEVLSFIRDYATKNHAGPTYAEISEHFNWSSHNSAHDVVNKLEARGHLSVRRGVSRGIWAVRK